MGSRGVSALVTPRNHTECDSCRIPGTLFFGFASFAERDNLCRIDRLAVNLHLDDFAALVDQIVDAPRGFVLRIVKPVFFGDFAAPVAQQREGHSDFFRPGVIAEHAVHAYTQYLGVCSFQLCQVLLEVLHLLRSTTGESENIKRQRDVLLPAKVVSETSFPLVSRRVKSGARSPTLTLGSGMASFFSCPPRPVTEASPPRTVIPSAGTISPPRMFCRVSPPMVLAAGEIIPKDAAFRRSRISVSSERNGGGCHGGPDRTAIGGPGVARAVQRSKRSLRSGDSRAGRRFARHAGLLAQDHRLRPRHRCAANRRFATRHFPALAGRRPVAAGES